MESHSNFPNPTLPNPTLPNRYALIVDTDTIRAVLERAARLNLPRRECHPLDRSPDRRANSALDKYDAEIETAMLATGEMDAIDALIESIRDPQSGEAVSGDDEDF